jgi:signal transduction histidine kinase
MPRSPEHAIPRLLGRAVLLPVLAMVALSCVLVLESRELLSLASWVDHTDRVIAHVQELARRYAESESALRGYAVTRRPAFLEPFAEAQKSIPPSFNELRELVADNPAQTERLGRIEQEARSWESFALEAIDRLRKGGEAPEISRGAGKARMDALRGHLEEFVKSEEGLLSERTTRATAAARWVAFGSVALVLLLGILLGLFARRQLAALAVGYRAALGAARETIELREDFLTVAAHELRTPLTALQLQLQRQQRETAKRGGDASTGDMALRQTRRLAALIESLIDAHALSSGSDLPLKREELDLAVLARGVAARLAVELAHLRCPIEVVAPAPVLGSWDRARLEQLLAALISNACKYGEGKPVRVEAGAEGELARFAVSDQGIGIAPEQQERIFGRFGRAVSPRAYGGFGLGLYAARRIAELHGGLIQVASRAGEGATFTLRLPRAKHQQSAA